MDVTTLMTAVAISKSLPDSAAAEAAASAAAAAESAEEAAASAAQASEIAANIPEDYSELSDDVSNLKSAVTQLDDFLLVPTEVETIDHYYIGNNGIASISSGNTIISDYIDVSEYKTIKIKAWAYWGNRTYAWYNSNKELVSLSDPAPNTSTHTSYENVLAVPSGVKYIVLSGFNMIDNSQSPIVFVPSVIGDLDDLETTAKDNLVEAINEANQNVPNGGVTETKLDSTLRGKIRSFEATNEAVDDFTDQIYVDSQATIEGHYYIGNNGVTGISSGATCVSDYVDVSKCEKIKIRARAYYACRFYAWYDSSKELVSVSDAAPNTSDHTLYEAEITVPSGAAYIVVAGFNNAASEYPKAYLPKLVVNDYKEYVGKKWVCIGDSLTAINTRTNKHYYDYVSEKTGISIVNLGTDGAGYKRKYDENKAFYQRISDVPTDADVVTIFGSGNDGTYVANDLGTVTDTGTETLCGCINTAIDALIARIPTVSLGIVSPTPWVGNPPSNPSCSMAIISDTLKTICANRSIPFLDLYHCSNLRPWTEEGRAACYTKDDGNGVHPDETGHKLIAGRFKVFVESLLC